MYKLMVWSLLASAALLLASCGGANAPVATNTSRNANAPASNSQTSLQHGTSPTANLGVASSHGGGGADSAAGGAASSTAAPVETTELDAKIQKAEAKAKAAGASESDKKAAAAAYFERADVYREQGLPTLYKFALRDYRIGLRFDPSASGPRQRMDEIVQIYQSMGRPVPDLGNEP